MTHFGNIDLDKFGQIMNALLHTFTDVTEATTEVTKPGQVGFSTAQKRILYFDGTTIQQVANYSDLAANGNKILVSETDPASTVTVVDGDGWFKPSTNLLQIRDTTWKSTASTTTFIIPSWTANIAYGPLAMVIFNSQLWRNETAGTNNHAVWTPASWTRIGGITLNKAVATITPAILHGTTVGNITRTNKVYRITHSLGTTSVFTRILKNNNLVQTDVTIIDANNIDITFNTPAQTSGKTYNVIVAEI